MSVTTLKIGGFEVAVTEDQEPRDIYRGETPDGKPQLAGQWPGKGWRFQVGGMMSGSAPTHAAALARAEYYVRAGDKRGLRPRFAMTRAAAEAVLDMEAADTAGLLATYPFEPADVAKLKGIGFLDDTGAVARNREAEIAVLMGIVPNPF